MAARIIMVTKLVCGTHTVLGRHHRFEAGSRVPDNSFAFAPIEMPRRCAMRIELAQIAESGGEPKPNRTASPEHTFSEEQHQNSYHGQ